MTDDDASPADRQPPRATVALLLVDVLNDLEFDGGVRLLEPALQAARRIAALKRRCMAAGVPAIYANDHHGRWRADVDDLVRHLLEDGVRGEPLARLLEPEPEDLFLFKPRHSAFFATPLETVLGDMGVRSLVLCGFSAEMCVLFTATDAYMRGYRVYMPRDCVAGEDPDQVRAALALAERAVEACTLPSTELDIEALGGR